MKRTLLSIIWKDEGLAFKVSEDPKGHIRKGCVLERPNVINNATTGKFVMWSICFLLIVLVRVEAAYAPDCKLKPDDYTVLMGVDAELSEGLKAFQGNSHAKFYLKGWRQPEQQAVSMPIRRLVL